MDSLSAILAASAAEHLGTISGNAMSPAVAAFVNSTATVPSPQQTSYLFNSPLNAFATSNLKIDYSAFSTIPQNVVTASPLSVGSSIGTSEASPLSLSLSPADIELVSKLIHSSPHAAASIPSADGDVLRVMRNFVAANQQTSPLSSMIASSSSAAASPLVSGYGMYTTERNERFDPNENPRRIRRRRAKSPQTGAKRSNISEDEGSKPFDESTASPAASVASSVAPVDVMIAENDDSGEEGQRPKTCRVCGDQATGYNFDVISCSCKAYFRRNANRTKEFKCPYNDNCEITPATRRFCQKCRLRKCFEVGMKKEWILNDEQLKRRKNSRLNCKKSSTSPRSPMEMTIRTLNFQERQSRAVKSESIDYSPLAAKSELINPLSPAVRLLDSPLCAGISPLNASTFTPLRSVSEVPVSTIRPSSVIIPITEVELPILASGLTFPPPFTSQSTPLATIGEELMPPLQVMTSSQCITHPPPLDRSPSLRPATGHYGQSFNLPLIESASQFPTVEPPVKQEAAGLSQVPETSGYGAGSQLLSPGSDRNAPMFSLFALSPSTFHSLGRHMQNAYADWSPLIAQTSTETTETQVEAKSAERESSPVSFKESRVEEMNLNSFQLNSSELCALDVVRQAYYVMDEPLEEDYENTRGAECLSKNHKDPSDLLNIMDVTMRRFVKMTKRLSAFVRLSQDGKLALLKAAMIQMLTVRGVTRFDTQRFCWSAPVAGRATVSCHVFDQLNDTSSQSKNRFLQFCERIPDEIKSNPMIINLIGLIILFQQTNVLTDHRDRTLARESHALYSNLLRRYLESTIHPYARARAVIGSIPSLLEELGVISNVAETLFVGRVKVAEVEQLPQEFFVTYPQADSAECSGYSTTQNDKRS